MYTQNPSHRLVPAFMVASIAFSIVTPLPSEDSLGNTSPEEFAQKAEIASLMRQDDAFVKPLGPEFQEHTDYVVVGDTSFLATKLPPTKKYAVTSRQWLFVTAYSSTLDQTDDSPFITASGSHVRDGIVAANFAYFSTKLRFPTLYGDRIFVVEDRMNPRYPYRIDIWMRTREEAKQFGVKIVPIEIIKEI